MIHLDSRPAQHRGIHNLSFLVLGVAGVLLETIGFGVINATRRGSIALAIIVVLFGAALLTFGCAFFAAGKRRSPWFGLLGLLGPIGLLFLAVLDEGRTGEDWDEDYPPQKAGKRKGQQDDFTPFTR